MRGQAAADGFAREQPPEVVRGQRQFPVSERGQLSVDQALHVAVSQHTALETVAALEEKRQWWAEQAVMGVPPLEYWDGLVAVTDSLLDLGQDVGELWRDEQDALGVGLGWERSVAEAPSHRNRGGAGW